MIQWINCSFHYSSSIFSLDLTRKLSIFIQLGSYLGKEAIHTWISSEPWKRNEEIMLEILSHVGPNWVWLDMVTIILPTLDLGMHVV